MTTSPPDAKMVAHAAMARSRLARTQAYLERDRQFAETSDTDLADLWVDGMKAWAADVRSRSSVLDDADAEYELRGQEAPYDRVRLEFETIMAGVEQASRNMTDEDRDRANDEMYAEYKEDQQKKN